MAKRALSWRRAATIALRDLKSSPAKFFFVVLSVAVGVGALVGLRGFSLSFRQTLSTEARSLMASDLSARIFRQATPEESAKLAKLTQQGTQSPAVQATGIETTWITETISMASAPPDPMPILVALKAVDPAVYPFYGRAELLPDQPLSQALSGDSVVVADEFLVRMNAHVGGTLLLGGHEFRITAVLHQEPDRMSSGASLGPRVLISRALLEKTGLIGYGSRATERLLLKLPATADPVSMRKQIEAILPDAQVMDYREGNPALTEGLDNATSILSLICLVAMVLGAIGVAMAMHAHLEERMDMLAILKAIGASSTDLLRIFLLQTVGLGLAGALVGVGIGLAFMYILPAVFGHLIPVHTTMSFPWPAVFAGVATGLLTTILFCLPPLLEVRNIRPILVLRRLVDTATDGFFHRWLNRWPHLLLSGIVLLALGLIARALSDSNVVAIGFLVALTITLAILLLVAALTLFLLRFTLNRIRLHLPSSLRQGLSNLYRPGNQSAPVLAALGVGVLLILSVYLFQSSIVRQIRETAAPNLPNIFLVDISSEEVAGVQKFFQDQQGIKQPLELIPITVGRFKSLNGKTIDQLYEQSQANPDKAQHYPRRMLQSAELTWADTPPAGDKVTSGKWWSSPTAHEIAVGNGIAERLHLGLGSTVELEVGGETHWLRVTALYKADGEHLGARAPFVISSGELINPRAIWYGGLHIDPARIPTMERALFIAYPTITIINLADVLTRVEEIVDQITFVIRFLAGFSIFAGLMILASSISSTRFRRMREAVILKTLGASRLHIIRVFTVEFTVLGLLAGSVGVIFANLLIKYLLHRMSLDFHFNAPATFTALFVTVFLATATGWLTSHRILGLRPLEILREE
jgi:putative ABC transport system permease protein